MTDDADKVDAGRIRGGLNRMIDQQLRERGRQP